MLKDSEDKLEDSAFEKEKDTRKPASKPDLHPSPTSPEPPPSPSNIESSNSSRESNSSSSQSNPSSY